MKKQLFACIMLNVSLHVYCSNQDTQKEMNASFYTSKEIGTRDSLSPLARDAGLSPLYKDTNKGVELSSARSLSNSNFFASPTIGKSPSPEPFYLGEKKLSPEEVKDDSKITFEILRREENQANKNRLAIYAEMYRRSHPSYDHRPQFESHEVEHKEDDSVETNYQGEVVQDS